MPYYLTEDNHTSKRPFVQFYCNTELSSLFWLGCWAKRERCVRAPGCPPGGHSALRHRRLAATPSVLGLWNLAGHHARPREQVLCQVPRTQPGFRGVCSDSQLRAIAWPLAGAEPKHSGRSDHVLGCPETVVQRRARWLNPPSPSFWGRCVPLTSRGKTGLPAAEGRRWNSAFVHT